MKGNLRIISSIIEQRDKDGNLMKKIETKILKEKKNGRSSISDK